VADHLQLGEPGTGELGGRPRQRVQHLVGPERSDLHDGIRQLVQPPGELRELRDHRRGVDLVLRRDKAQP
jgi:hypothetical protein